jgi:hypothetical protein
VQFFHVRHYDNQNQLLAQGGYCFALIDSSKVAPQHSELSSPEYRWGVSKCHEKDTYDKRMGRIRAAGRAVSNKFFFKTSEMVGDDQPRLFVRNIARLMSIANLSHPTEITILHAMNLTNRGILLPLNSINTHDPSDIINRDINFL